MLDIQKDGVLSRSELRLAAEKLGLQWQAAPLLAVFDLLTLLKPMPKELFMQYMAQIDADPLGPYGKVLLNAPLFAQQNEQRSAKTAVHKFNKIDHSGNIDKVFKVLHQTAGMDCAYRYINLLNTLAVDRLDADETALLIIDPQKSFTQGVWMRSIGRQAEQDVAMLKLAFENSANLVNALGGKKVVMFTRCPFPPGSYGWDRRFAAILDADQPYFIKPGNSVLFPPSNGFIEQIECFLDNGIHTLVIGGCTLNSCVRVSSVEVQEFFKDRLQVVTDVSLCGARVSNYAPSATFGGLSAVESAIQQMTDAGVRAVRYVAWQ